MLNAYQYPAFIGWRSVPSTSYHALSFAVTGQRKGHYALNGTRSRCNEINRHRCIILPSSQSISWDWRPIDNNPEAPVSLATYLSPTLLQEAALKTLDVNPDQIELRASINFQDEFIGALLNELKNELEHGTPYGKIFGDTAAQLLALHLLRKYCTIRYQLPNYSKKLPRQALRKVISRIHDELSNDIRLSELASESGLSRYHFARLFKISTGLSPHQYIVKCRMEKAKTLLRCTNWTMYEIAIKSGYKNQSHFAKLFKEFVGVTPTQFREKI